MATVIQDFRFNSLSGLYGRFLGECEESGVTIENVTPKFVSLPYVKDAIYVSTESPEHIAVVLKLTYGAYLVERPVPAEFPDWEALKAKQLSTFKFIKYKKSDYYIKDYLDILKYKDDEIKDEEAKIRNEEIYKSLKEDFKPIKKWNDEC